MTETSKGISVSYANDQVYVRVAGRGTFQNGQPLRRYSLEMINRGCHNFVVDLSQCQGMDSTFLGVLAGLGLRLAQDGRSDKICVVNVSARNLELVQTLGLDRLFNLDAGSGGNHRAPPEAEFHKLPESDVTELSKPLNKNDTANLMLEAHENLIRADARNVDKFRDVAKNLRESVERRAAAQQLEREPEPDNDM